jgi:hypothetical protein
MEPKEINLPEMGVIKGKGPEEVMITLEELQAAQAAAGPMAGQMKPSIVVTESVYFRARCCTPSTLVQKSYSRELTTDEQAYDRKPYKVTGEWRKLDTGWVDQPSLVILGECGSLLELSFGGQADLIIPSGEYQRFTPGSVMPMVRCPDGQAVCRLIAFPR